MATVIKSGTVVYKRDCQYIFVKSGPGQLYHVHIAQVNHDVPGSDATRGIVLYYQYQEHTRLRALLLTRALTYGATRISPVDAVAQWVYDQVVLNTTGRMYLGQRQDEQAVTINPNLRLRN